MGTGRGIRQALGRIPAAVRDSRGMALIMAVYFTFAVGMLLFAFTFLNQNEAGFAGFNRDSTEALSLADAGAQEAVDRLSPNGVGGVAGTTCFGISLANGAACSASPTAASLSNQVFYEAPLASNSLVFPIISVGTFAGRQRAVRLFEQAIYKTGFANVIYGPQVTFQGNGQPITGDTYSATSVIFQSYAKSPPPASGATNTNLVAPQVMAGSTICAGGPCPASGSPGPYTYECASSSRSEVAPTACSRALDSGSTALPVNWHPMVPIGMPTADFQALVSACYNGTTCSAFMSFVPAAQNGVNLTYTQASYTPVYWSAPTAATNGQIVLAVATGPFCVNGASVAGSACTGGGITYGSGSSSTSPLRYLDWGLVTDDLSRSTSSKFFQPPSCPTCNAGGPNGNQNGIRYIPLPPSLIPTPLTSLACKQNVNPGSNVFDNITADGLTCPAPITMTSTTNVTFSGRKSNPEFLVIDNGPPETGGTCGSTCVHISGSINGPGSCSSNFDSYNWGIIVATGDIDLTANMVFSGFIYTAGYVFSHGTVVVSGGIYSASSTGGTQVNQVDTFGNVNFCGSSNTQVVLSPQFFTFKTISWQDLPLNSQW